MTITTAHELNTYLDTHPLPIVVLERRRPWIITECEDPRDGYDAWSYESHVEDNGCKSIEELQLPLEVLSPADPEAALQTVLAELAASIKGSVETLTQILAAHGGGDGPTPVG